MSTSVVSTAPEAAAAAAFTTTSFSGTAAADTAGWDTVYALKVGVINEALADYFAPGGRCSSSMAFTQSLDGTNAVTMTGEFGAWQITTGGSGEQINLRIPIVSGTATINGIGLDTPTIDLAGAAIIVRASLGFHAVDFHAVDAAAPAPRPGASAGAATQATAAALKVVTGGSAPATGSAADIRSAAKTATSSAAPADQAVTVAGVIDLGLGHLSQGSQTTASTFIEALAKMWIADNLWMFDYVFLTIDVAETAAQGEWAWITPTFVGYAITDLLDADGHPLPVENSIMAVMSLTEGRLPGRQPDGSTIAVSPSVSVSAIPTNPGVNAGFLIQPGLLLEKIFAVNMPTLFSGATSSDFIVSSDSLTISNANPLTLQLEMDPTWYPFSKTCTATIGAGDLGVSLTQTEVHQTFSNISFPYGYQKEMTIDLSLASHSTIGVDGNKGFTMQYGGDTTSTLSVQPDASKIAAEALEGIGVNLVVTALCCLSFGAAGGEASALTDAGAGTGAKVDAGIPTAENLGADAKEVANAIDEGAAAGAKAGGEIELPNQLNAIGPESIKSELAQTAAAEVRDPSTWTLKGIMPRFTFKIWAMFVGQFAGEVYTNISNVDMIEAYRRDPTSMPTLQSFLARCISPATWLNGGDQELVCAGLNGAFVVGFKVPSSKAGATS